MSANVLDAAFMREQERLEIEQQPIRREFDELVRTISSSQTPAETRFGVAFDEDEIVLPRDNYVITAKIEGTTIAVSISQPEGANFETAMLAGLSACYPATTSAPEAAAQIGSLMARLVEGRVP